MDVAAQEFGAMRRALGPSGSPSPKPKEKQCLIKKRRANIKVHYFLQEVSKIIDKLRSFWYA
jgi:hypothetical protein